jgi:hypothetical protein
MIRSIVAVLIGMVVAIAGISAIDALNHAIYPPPESLVAAAKRRDFDAVRRAATEWLPIAPTGALVLVPAGWIIGTFLGALTAGIIAPRSRMPPLIVGGLIFVATAANLMMLPHPVWIAAVGLVGVSLAAIVAMWLTSRLQSPGNPQPYDMREKNMAC